MNTERIHALFATLGETNDDLLSILDDLWLEIDHTDADSIRQGSERMIAVVKSIQEYQAIAERLKTQITAFTPESEAKAILPDLPAPVPSGYFSGRVKIGLSSDWSYKRPLGFILRGKQYQHLHTWIDLYIKFCLVLKELNPALFGSLPDRTALISTHGNKYFSREIGALRSPYRLSDDILMETNLSAKLIRNNIRRLASIYSIQESEIEIYLRKE